ncbi:MAG: hypothetical protein R3208_04255 [Ketobacteraceae bacterium]|nr:hypothetical protein [Ketobacteraceae bacterium]
MSLNPLKSLIFIGVTWAMLGACSESPYAGYSDMELQEAHHKCENADSLSPGGAIRCDNVRRECQSRAKEKGRTLCF